jgi:phosphoenolpyruvate phosphomutase
MRRLVRKLGQRDIAGVCIEDKLFPKTNSFIGEGQPLADIDEFCGKIKAGTDSRSDDDFCIVARVEALISGWGLEEALRRANAYYEAGADAVLIHSKRSHAGEIMDFMRNWHTRCPVVVVPTTYYGTPTAQFRAAGVGAVIWANHNLRAAITAMRDTTRAIFESQSIAAAEEEIAPLRDVFHLAGNAELNDAERRYLPQQDAGTRAIVLAASRGDGLGPLTSDKPKCMIAVRGKPLLGRLVETLRESGIRDISVVRGYCKDAVDIASITTYDNDRYDSTGEAASLACALESLEGDCVISYGDIIFRRYILDNLLAAKGDIIIGVDGLLQDRNGRATGRSSDLVQCTEPFTGAYLDGAEPQLTRVGSDIPAADAQGEWIGLARTTPLGSERIRAVIASMLKDGCLDSASLPDIFNRLAQSDDPPTVVYVTGHWLNINDVFDLAEARDVASRGPVEL